MNSIFSLFASMANLARSLNRMASVVDAVADEAERRVELVGHTPAAQVTHEPDAEEPSRNGTARRKTVLK